MSWNSLPSPSYKFELSYAERDRPTKMAPPISAFGVDGGASRTIHADSPDSLSVGSEFEQARKFRNIILYMPGSPGAGDMKTAIDFLNFAANKTRFFFHFSVRQTLNSKLVYLLNLTDHATVKKSPIMVLGDLLMAEFNLPDAGITHWDSKGERSVL